MILPIKRHTSASVVHEHHGMGTGFKEANAKIRCSSMSFGKLFMHLDKVERYRSLLLWIIGPIDYPNM